MKLLITLPCYNEEVVLEKSVRNILDYAQKELTHYDWTLLLLDNASSDRTNEIADELVKDNARIIKDQCLRKGRGAALSMAWQKYSGYDIYSYMDIDLATDISTFAAILDKLKAGYDIAVGSRYVAGSKVYRSLKREALSRVYNLVLKLIFKVKFRDAQCGFKAYNRRVIFDIIPYVEDTGWFWDTESLILAERKGYKLAEVPVKWQEVRDEIRQSKVSPFVEIVRQLVNIYLLRKRINE